MTEVLGALLAGVLVGLLVVLLLSRELVRGQVESEVTQWRSSELYSVRREALDRSRPDVQRRVGSTIARWTHSFPFLQEDSRFIGHPVDYVVFEGYSEVRARREPKITAVTFVRARENGRDDPDGRLVEECVRLGRIEWRTIEIAAPVSVALPLNAETARITPRTPGHTVRP